MKTFTLANLRSQRIYDPDKGWIDANLTLTPPQRAALFELFAKGCHQATKSRISACFLDNCQRVKPCGILDRVTIGGDSASYCAGQSYVEELAFVRKILIASY